MTSDHRRIILQLLPVPEIIDKDDWIFSVRIATYTSMEDSKLTHKYASKRIHRLIDVPIARSSTVQQLYQKLLEMFPFFQMSTATTTITPPAESSNGSDTTNNKDDDAVSHPRIATYIRSQRIRHWTRYDHQIIPQTSLEFISTISYGKIECIHVGVTRWYSPGGTRGE